MANTFLEKSERAEKAGVSEKILNQYRGEAYFTRACKYAVLVSFFGDVVWLDKNIYIEEAFQKGRTPKKRDYTFNLPRLRQSNFYVTSILYR